MSGPVYKVVPFRDSKLTIYAGLHYIRGNKAPHFNLTASTRDMGGCLHDEILGVCPELAPLADLHLSDIYGVPMYAVANGWYWLEGAAAGEEGWGSRSHGGQDKEPEECRHILGRYLRLNSYELDQLIGSMTRLVQHCDVDAAKKVFEGYVERLKPRWRVEADETIKQFNLQVYGDYWRAPTTTE
jgi:hypothetical protein